MQVQGLGAARIACQRNSYVFDGGSACRRMAAQTARCRPILAARALEHRGRPEAGVARSWALGNGGRRAGMRTGTRPCGTRQTRLTA